MAALHTGILAIGLFNGLAFSASALAAPTIWVSRAEPHAETVNPSSTFSLRLAFKGFAPTTTPHKVTLQFLDAQGRVSFSAEHDPALLGARKATTAWVGDISYAVPSITVPAVAAGSYRIAISLADAATGARMPLMRVAGDPFTADLLSYRYQVGWLTVTNKRIVDAPFACNGVTDVSLALRDAFSHLQTGEVLRLPMGTCVYSAIGTPPADNCTSQDYLPLRLPYWLQNADVVGRGVPSTVLKAMNVDTSALFADAVSGVVIRDLAITVQSDGQQRRFCPVANGISIFSSTAVDIERVQVSTPAAAGVLLFGVQDVRVQNSRILASMADGIQATHASKRVTLNNNYILNSGDDALSSTGYVPDLNESVTITNNTVVNSGASGIAVEGTSATTIKGNLVQGSQVAGLRIASISSWKTGAVTGLTATNNTLSSVRRDTTVDHAAVMLFADQGNLSDITLTGNRINSASAIDGIRVRGSALSQMSQPQYWASNITLTNNMLSSGPGALLMRRCVHLPLPYTVINTVIAGNTLNGLTCPTL